MGESHIVLVYTFSTKICFHDHTLQDGCDSKQVASKTLVALYIEAGNDALNWFHAWDQISPPCSHKFMLPHVVDGTLFGGSIILKEENKLKIPIGSMILPTLHVVCFRRSNGQPMISKIRLFPSCGRSYLESS